MNIPCRVELDTRKYYSDMDKAYAADADAREERKWDAMMALTEADKLAKVLEDEALAIPLADLFTNRERAMNGDKVALDAIYAAIFRMEKTCFQWLMGDE